MNMPLVTNAAVPPAGKPGECFWCKSPVGGFHKTDCPKVVRRAKIRAIFTYEVDVHGGGADDAMDYWERHRNEGSWCSTNAVHELVAVSNRFGCLCQFAKFAFVKWMSDDLEESK